ncbi:protein tramtrack, beta isoform-like isoform X3 [Plodia interpunctella]|uniref:protein tramtrack, beta isoform-like isoform X3 n=1 Tax=Plodia interpunctella TaxID=58824 RepID=UPI00236855B9|nr:protein tramtrack, beta isoform-like isoform X3 [Plodia interpunctella]
MLYYEIRWDTAAGASSDMGSEHYCLRWNNHQSNLLGVFSQLLHDESLVDVTLACSEGASIRAHKVVLSACSSYFRSLFVDHPSRHPIVILKDVGLEELRTIVDFMYKGEVNVQYCQLPALLKTAESLQVKGLAEMTTLSAAGIDTRNVAEPMEECQSQDPKESTDSHERLDNRESRDKEEKRDAKETRDSRERENKDSHERDSHGRESRESRDLRQNREREGREPRDLREHRDHRDVRESREPREPRDHREHARDREPRDLRDIRDPRDLRDTRETRDGRETSDASPPRISPLLSVRRFRSEVSIDTSTPTHPPIPKDEPPDEPMRSSSPEDDSVSIRSNGAQNDSIGINMTINSHSSSVLGPRYSPVEQRLSVLNAIPHPGLPHPSHQSLPSPRSEPIAGPSGLPPVQQVPLSLKKEIDWDRSNEDKGGESSLEYRMQHETEYDGPGRVRIEEGERGYPCIHCGAAFPHQSKLARHILTTHTLDTLKYRDAMLARPMGLPMIGQFTEPTYMGMPAEESPIDLDIGAMEPGNVVLCKFCGKSFPDVSSLIAHLPVHTGDRPFKCEFCGKAFKLRHHMKDHCRVHTGERPFRCVLCGKTFSRSTILKAHEKTHYPKYARKFLSPSPVDTEEESPHQ